MTSVGLGTLSESVMAVVDDDEGAPRARLEHLKGGAGAVFTGQAR